MDEPVESSFATNALEPPFREVWNAPVLVGKSVEIASPATYTQPEESTAMA
jgi:hypothetical protein